jgi:hypothetical protein
MLETMEVLKGGRRTIRRAVELDCDVLSRYWDESVPFTALDLSLDGMWLDAMLPLEVGETLTIRFKPPRWRSERALVVNAEVRRVDLNRRPRGSTAPGMGIAFVDLLPWERDALRMAIEGLPPPIPMKADHTPKEMVWVDSVLTWEEDLGDRVNIYEVSELLGVDDEFEALDLAFFAVGEILTSPRKRSWLLAA